MCVVMWLNCSGKKYQWFLGYVTSEQNGLLVDHLHHIEPDSHSKWAYPTKEDVQVAQHDQILKCTVIGEWDLKDPRKTRFTLTNIKDI